MQNSSKGNNSWKNHRTRTRRWYAHPPSILNIPMKFQWNPTSSFREFAWTRTVPYIFMQNSSKGNNSWKNHRTRTRRWYAHPPLILNIPMKFHWNPTSSFREFAWTRAGRTHGRTDTRTYGRTDARTHGRSGDYMLPRNSSGSIKMAEYLTSVYCPVESIEFIIIWLWYFLLLESLTLCCFVVYSTRQFGF